MFPAGQVRSNNRYVWRRLLGLKGLLCLLTGCAPVIAPAVLKQVDTGISYRQLAADPVTFKGKVVLFGGTIARTTPRAGETELEVVQRELNWRNEPSTSDTSEGRFLVLDSRFLDPEIYQEGRRITVAGEVMGGTVHKLGEADYRYPVIKAQDLYLWPKVVPYQPRIYFWGPYPGFYWGPYPYGPGYWDRP